MPAPLGNTNNLKHGGRAKRPGAALAKLGEKYQAPYRDACRLRKLVRREIEARQGSVTISQYARLQTLARIELSARVLEQTLRDTPDLTAEEIRQSRHMTVQWSLQRDNLLAELLGDSAKGGPAGGASGWEAFYAAQRARLHEAGSQVSPVDSDASGATPEPPAGQSEEQR